LIIPEKDEGNDTPDEKDPDDSFANEIEKGSNVDLGLAGNSD